MGQSLNRHFHSTKFYGAKAVGYIFALLVLLSGCGPGFRHAPGRSVESDYNYKDPRAGEPVAMKESEQRTANDQTTTLKITELKNTRVQILADHSVQVSVDKISDGHVDHVELRGVLTNDLGAALVDTQPIGGLSRLKGYVQCSGKDGEQKTCSELFVEFYFFEKGAKQSRQFTVYNSAATATIVDPKKSDVSPPKIGELGRVNSKEPQIASPDTSAKSVDEPENVTPDAPKTGTHMVMPAVDDQYYADIINDAPKPETKPKAKPEDNLPEIVVEAPRETNAFTDLVLLGGGQSKDYVNSGAIIKGPSTLIPKRGIGYRRSQGTEERKAYGTGYSVSFIEISAREFSRTHADCGDLVIGNSANAKGGTLYFGGTVNGQSHAKSHQNGLDFDMAYSSLPDLNSVVRSQRTTKDFNVACNFEWLKLIANAERTDHIMAVNGVLIHKSVAKNLCRYKKTHNLNSREDDRIEEILYPMSDHDNHMHVRLNCSPKHAFCIDERLEAPGCENI